MAVAEPKKKKPPTFPYLPKSSAKRLKKSWVQDHKIRSKWKAQKRREGLATSTSTSATVEADHDHHGADADADAGSGSDDPQEKSPTLPAASHDKQSLRELRKLAYASKSLQAGSPQSKRAREHPRNNCGRQAKMGQPDMNLRMNVLLEQIKRNLS